MTYIRDTGVEYGYRPVISPVLHEMPPVAPMHHTLVTDAHRPTQRRFKPAQHIPWIVLALLFVLSPFFAFIVACVYGMIFFCFMCIGWAGGRRI